MASSSIPHRWKYDVFVSFRGEDIRKNFMDHLFSDFKQKGIYAFRDDNTFPEGEEISPQLYKAIEESRFLIIIFSKNYASSSWCLRELVKILKCKQMENPKYEVRIIFYDVKRDVLRKQKRSYAEAFAKHEVSNRTEVDEWKEALSMAANLSGWDLLDMTREYKSTFIDSISKEILKWLCDGPLHVGENLVGVDIHIDKLDLLCFVGSDKVNMIGICGISGIGKTTRAKAIYNLMYIHFEESCFCEDVQGVTKRKGLTEVQMDMIHKILKTEDKKISSIGEGTMVISQRIGCKPILLVLDDVNDLQQLEALAGSHDWFSPGSLIIITCKDKQLLRSHKVDMVHEMRTLDYYDALELFCLYAFGIKHATEDFKKLASQIVNHMQGHPLALKVFGRLLYGKSVSVWKSEFYRLQAYSNSEIQQKLLPSYEGLDYDQKSIFLDIACSFIGENRYFAASVLDSNDYFPNAGIEVLVDRSLVTLSAHDMSLQMHELIQSMAREIVRKESSIPGNQSRFWVNPSEIYTVLSENNATQVEIIDLLHKRSSQEFDIDVKAFAHMKNLRILKLPMDPVVNYSGKLEYLSNNLRLFCWHGCPFKQLPSDFYPQSIVAIDLSYSHIQNLWTTPKYFRRLKVMKLSYCFNLRSTPDCTEIPNLEELYLDGCVNLVEVHPSVGMLKRLAVLNIRNCKRLKSFPSKLEMDSLQILDLSGCSLMDQVYPSIWRVSCLLEAKDKKSFDGSGFGPPENKIDPSNFLLGEKEGLSLSEAKDKKPFDGSGFGPPEKKTDLSNFLLEEKEGLSLSEAKYKKPFDGSEFGPPEKKIDPSNVLLGEKEGLSLSGMSMEVDEIDLKDTRTWSSLLNLLLQLPRLTLIPPTLFEHMPLLEVLDLSSTSIQSLPSSISSLSSLQKLILRDCLALIELPPEIGMLTKLKFLDIEGSEIMYIPKEIGKLTELEVLRASLSVHADYYIKAKSVDVPFTIPRKIISELKKLKELCISVCQEAEWWEKEVKEIQDDLCHLENLEILKWYLPTDTILEQFLEVQINGKPIYENLSHFNLTIGQHAQLTSCLPRDLEKKFEKFEKCIKWINAEGNITDISKIMALAEALFLSRHWTIVKLSAFNITELKYILLAECNEMETLVEVDELSEDVENGRNVGLESLQYLSIHCMDKLKSIWKGPPGKDSLSRLTVLALHTCQELTTIFTPSIAQNLSCLTELIVEDCPKLRSLMSDESPNVDSVRLFPSLEKIFLLDLPELVCIFGGPITLEQLDGLLIYNCLKLQYLSIKELPHIQTIKGENEWWSALKNDTSAWENVFEPLKEKRELITQLLEATNSLQHFHDVVPLGKSSIQEY